jgi:signal transduction histidine kinase
VRHSGADVISVEVGVVDDTAFVLVEDDGVGIGGGGRRSGLKNLEEKAAARGGDFTADSRAGSTAVRWSVPLEPPPHDGERTGE